MYRKSSTSRRAELDPGNNLLSADRRTGGGAPWRVPTGGLVAPKTDHSEPDNSGVFLGNNTNIAAIASGTAFPNDGAARRILHYVLQSSARELLAKDERLGKCLRCPRVKGGSVQVFRSRKHGSAHYGGLVVCARHWVCPVCAIKIASRRVVEVEQAISTVQKSNGAAGFLTLTFPHYHGQAVKPMVERFLKSLRSFKSHRRYKELMQGLGALGEIRSLEVTYGSNGWHPHTHSLHLFPSEIVFEELQGVLRPLWASVALRHGLGEVHAAHGLQFEHVLDAQESAERVARYAVKWGASDELVRGNSKRARSGGRTPFALLADYATLDDRDAGVLFVQYAAAFRGKNHINWSPGLRENLSEPASIPVREASDYELATARDDDADLLGVISQAQWKSILKARPSVRGELLEVARSGDWLQVVQFIEGFSKGVRLWQGESSLLRVS